MGRTKLHRPKKTRPFISRAKLLSEHPRLVPGSKAEACIECGHGAVWRHKRDLRGGTVMRTSPFISVETPHGRRVIHSYCMAGGDA